MKFVLKNLTCLFLKLIFGKIFFKQNGKFENVRKLKELVVGSVVATV